MDIASVDIASVDLAREYEKVVGTPLERPDLDIFDLGLASMAVLELISRLRELGYPIRMDDIVNAESMRAVAHAMSGMRS